MAKYEIDNIASPIDFQEANIVKRTLQNAKNLLMCRMGEVPYDRYRGFDTGLYDLPITQVQTELVPELDRLMMWEPDVEVDDAEASLLPDGSMYIKVILNVKIAGDGSGENKEAVEPNKKSVNTSAPVDPVRTVWANAALPVQEDSAEAQEAAVRKANASIRKMVRSAKQVTVAEIYGGSGNTLNLAEQGGG